MAEGFGAFGKKSRCPWFKSSTLPLSVGFALDSPEFNSLTALYKKLTGQPPINWDSYNILCSMFNTCLFIDSDPISTTDFAYAAKNLFYLNSITLISMLVMDVLVRHVRKQGKKHNLHVIKESWIYLKF